MAVFVTILVFIVAVKAVLGKFVETISFFGIYNLDEIDKRYVTGVVFFLFRKQILCF